MFLYLQPRCAAVAAAAAAAAVLLRRATPRSCREDQHLWDWSSTGTPERCKEQLHVTTNTVNSHTSPSNGTYHKGTELITRKKHSLYKMKWKTPNTLLKVSSLVVFRIDINAWHRLFRESNGSLLPNSTKNKQNKKIYPCICMHNSIEMVPRPSIHM